MPNSWVLTGAILLCSFFPLAAFSFMRYRMPKKKKELDNICLALKIDKDKDCPYFLFTPQEDYTFSDYLLPMGFCMIYCFCAFLLLFNCSTLQPGGADIGCEALVDPNLLLQGVQNHVRGELSYGQISLGATLVAVLGCYVWSIQYVARRLITLDLFPAAFYTIATRLVFASFITLALRHLLFANQVIPTTMLPPLAFFIGMFPQRGLRYIQNSFSPSFKAGKQAHALRLPMIEGINLFTHTRLTELGIDNAQNLAEANFVEILLKTPFNPNLLMDWMAQSQLYVRVLDRIEDLRGFGIRTVFDLRDALRVPEMRKALATAMEWEPYEVEIIAYSIENDSTIKQLEYIRNRLTRLEDMSGVASLPHAQPSPTP